MVLHQRFFQAAEIDLNAARILTRENSFQPALYHLQQAYEKYVKSHFIYMDTIVNNIPEDEAYRKAWKNIGHDTLNTTIKLLENVLDIQEQVFQSKLCRTTDPDHRTSLLNTINNTDKVRNTLRKQFSEFDLPNRYKDNIINYEKMVKEKYEDYQEASVKVTVMQTTDFAQLVLSMVSLYPCFYWMDEIARYPLKEFSYDNLNLLTNMRQPCENLIEILQELFDLVARYFREPE